MNRKLVYKLEAIAKNYRDQESELNRLNGLWHDVDSESKRSYETKINNCEEELEASVRSFQSLSGACPLDTLCLISMVCEGRRADFRDAVCNL